MEMDTAIFVITVQTDATPNSLMQMEMGEAMCVTRRQGVADAFNQRVRGSVKKIGEEVNPLRQRTSEASSAARRQKG